MTQPTNDGGAQNPLSGLNPFDPASMLRSGRVQGAVLATLSLLLITLRMLGYEIAPELEERLKADLVQILIATAGVLGFVGAIRARTSPRNF